MVKEEKGLVEVRILFKEPLNCLLLPLLLSTFSFTFISKDFYPNNLSNEQILRNKLRIKTKLYQISNMLWCIMFYAIFFLLKYYSTLLCAKSKTLSL